LLAETTGWKPHTRERFELVEQSSGQVAGQACEVVVERIGDDIRQMSEAGREYLRDGLASPLIDRVSYSSGVCGAASGGDGLPNPRSDNCRV
jgi:hypothetical protein